MHATRRMASPVPTKLDTFPSPNRESTRRKRENKKYSDGSSQSRPYIITLYLMSSYILDDIVSSDRNEYIRLCRTPWSCKPTRSQTSVLSAHFGSGHCDRSLLSSYSLCTRNCMPCAVANLLAKSLDHCLRFDRERCRGFSCLPLRLSRNGRAEALCPHAQ